MSTQILDHTTAEEKLIWYSLVLSYPVYFLGASYVLGSILGWVVLGIFLLRVLLGKLPATHSISTLLYLWVAGMLMMELALFMGHLEFNLGLGQLVKSSIGWAKGWALLALFISLGALMPIKKGLIARGACIVGFHSLLFFVLSLVVYIAGMSGDIYLSPIQAIGGPGPEFFQVKLFGINPETGLPRWQFFAPWSPAIGLQSCLMLILCLNEKSLTWKVLGISGALVMCLASQSRAGWFIFLVILPLLVLLSNVRNTKILFLSAITLTLIALPGQVLIDYALDAYQQVKDSRPGSTRVRGALEKLALQRWQHEAPIWGHGIVERGPHYVEHMAIGTHHSWYGLLFVKGIVGALALAIPLLFTALYLLFQAQFRKDAVSSLGLIIVLIAYSFFENLEILVYLYWPALLWIGASLRVEAPVKNKVEKRQQPKHSMIQGVQI